MIVLKTTTELYSMKEAGQISARALQLAGELVQPGITTREIDAQVKKYILSTGAKPSFLGYGGFPASTCISINHEVIHGIPSSRKIVAGDIVSVDVGAFYNGFHGDNAATFAAGTPSQQAQDLMDATKESLYQAIGFAKAGMRLGDISSAVEQYVVSKGYSVVRKYVGHGIGREMHEDPQVPNYGTAGRGIRLLPGMVLAIEPMVNEGSAQVKVLGDNWTVITADKSLSAHFEHTVAITEAGPVILTQP